MKFLVRPAKESDIPSLLEISNYHVQNGYSTFRTELETIEEKKNVFKQHALIGPYRILVAEYEGKVIGSARSFRYREDPVFERTVETGIYLDPKMKGKGVGSLLYKSLFEVLSKQDIHLVVVG